MLTLRSLVVGLGLTVTACNNSSMPTTTPTGSTGPTSVIASPAPPSPDGSSGLAGLDWGANADAVRAAFPNVTPTDGGLWYVGMVESHQAVTKFTIGAAGLDQVVTEWTEGFISMADCGTGWAKIRATLDGRFGPSQADNLAADWKTATAKISLACTPNDSNAGVLSLTYARN
ncbi:MAG: hypothetical protein NT062_08720 [Proteobacteria bacterium]|nr:hypothetical protein [Pseudomonadota bacterium]